MPSLTNKVLNSLGWVFTNMMAKNVLQFVRTVVLWKILSATDFGLQAIAWLVINALSLLQDMGFQNALIQRKKDLEAAISVTWYANVLIRVAIYGVVYAIAPAVAVHFNEPQVTSVLRVVSISIVLGSFGSANEALLRKNFQFKPLLFVDTAELVVQTSSQIILALLGYGVWSLVYGTIASTVARSFLMWWIAPIRVGRFDMAVAKDMFRFGMNISGSTFFLYLITNMDNYFVGKFLGTAALGFYSLAYRLSHLIATNVGRMLGSVLFPAFAEIGNDVSRVRPAWLRSVRYSMLVITPMGVATMVFAREIVLGFYPAECEVIILPIMILTIFAICRGIGVTLGDLAKGIGKPGILLRVCFWHFALMAPTLFLFTIAVGPGVGLLLSRMGFTSIGQGLALGLLAHLQMRVGLLAVSFGVSGPAFFGIGLSLYLTSLEVKYTAREVIEALKPCFIAGLAMGVFASLGKGVVAGSLSLLGCSGRATLILTFLLMGLFSALIYGLVLWLAFPAVTLELKKMLERRKVERREQKATRPPSGQPSGQLVG